MRLAKLSKGLINRLPGRCHAGFKIKPAAVVPNLLIYRIALSEKSSVTFCRRSQHVRLAHYSAGVTQLPLFVAQTSKLNRRNADHCRRCALVGCHRRLVTTVPAA